MLDTLKKYTATEFSSDYGYLLDKAFTLESRTQMQQQLGHTIFSILEPPPLPFRRPFSQYIYHHFLKWRRRIFSKENKRTMFAYTYLQICGLVVALAQIGSDFRWESARPQGSLPLPDMFDLFPPFQGSIEKRLPDIFLLPLLFVTVVYFCVFTRAPYRGILFRRLAWVIGTMYLFRGLTMTVTTLPPTQAFACSGAAEVKGFWSLLRVAVLMVLGVERACTDNIFSGHTGLMSVCGLTWWFYSKHGWIVAVVWVWVMVGVLWIILTRMHYTVDVLLAFFIAYALYRVYLAGVEYAVEWLMQMELGDSGRSEPESDVWRGRPDLRRHLLTIRNMRLVPLDVERRKRLVRWISWMDGIDLRWERWKRHHRGREPLNGDVGWFHRDWEVI